MQCFHVHVVIKGFQLLSEEILKQSVWYGVQLLYKETWIQPMWYGVRLTSMKTFLQPMLGGVRILSVCEETRIHSAVILAVSLHVKASQISLSDVLTKDESPSSESGRIFGELVK